MIHNRRVLPMLAFSFLATVSVACGVEGSNDTVADPDTTTTAPVDGSTTTEADGSTTTEPEGTTTTEPDVTTTTEPDVTTTTEGGDSGDYQDLILQGMIDAWVDGGLTTEQAECLADSYGRDVLDGVEMSASDMQQYLTDCDVSPTDFSG